jgi:hypothetical protein
VGNRKCPEILKKTIIVMANVNFLNFTCKMYVNVYFIMLVQQSQVCRNKRGMSFTPIFLYAECLYFISIVSTVHIGIEPV